MKLDFFGSYLDFNLAKINEVNFRINVFPSRYVDDTPFTLVPKAIAI